MDARPPLKWWRISTCTLAISAAATGIRRLFAEATLGGAASGFGVFWTAGANGGRHAGIGITVSVRAPSIHRQDSAVPAKAATATTQTALATSTRLRLIFRTALASETAAPWVAVVEKTPVVPPAATSLPRKPWIARAISAPL